MPHATDLSRWASAYVDAQAGDAAIGADHQLRWAMDWSMGLTTGGAAPDDLRHGILEVLARDPPEKVLAQLAAGPLEDHIHYQGREFIGAIGLQARRSPAFLQLLGGVWESGPPDVWERVQRARGSAIW